MAYAWLATLLVSVLSVRFLLSKDAYPRSKGAVGAAWLLSLLLPLAAPSWAWAGVLLQAALGIGLLMHARLQAQDRRPR